MAVGIEIAQLAVDGDQRLSERGSCFSEREIDTLKKIMKEDKIERSNNIVIKGIYLEIEGKIDKK